MEQAATSCAPHRTCDLADVRANLEAQEAAIRDASEASGLPSAEKEEGAAGDTERAGLEALLGVTPTTLRGLLAYVEHLSGPLAFKGDAFAESRQFDRMCATIMAALASRFLAQGGNDDMRRQL
ncbi:hypothetical protein GCM10007036_10300 [Alsobacter metallidurans]|uniref:Uncharacterized protein n=1 Tax=Alsobacter metallidurans TaxID=340221 RepID=A0A917I420_9HYPH|nr:hypothetical protein [Alsobacter metallidurans]GGH12465.1 hypothetical protein GCM10007036_10300 [Alsobacter metallidurans]